MNVPRLKRFHVRRRRASAVDCGSDGARGQCPWDELSYSGTVGTARETTDLLTVSVPGRGRGAAVERRRERVRESVAVRRFTAVTSGDVHAGETHAT